MPKIQYTEVKNRAAITNAAHHHHFGVQIARRWSSEQQGAPYCVLFMFRQLCFLLKRPHLRRVWKVKT